MEDLRKKVKLPVKGHLITAGYDINETSVKEMLTLMGVAADDAMIQDAIGFLSANSMEMDMSNLHEFLKTKSVMSSSIDKRKKK